MIPQNSIASEFCFAEADTKTKNLGIAECQDKFQTLLSDLT